MVTYPNLYEIIVEKGSSPYARIKWRNYYQFLSVDGTVPQASERFLGDVLGFDYGARYQQAFHSTAICRTWLRGKGPKPPGYISFRFDDNINFAPGTVDDYGAHGGDVGQEVVVRYLKLGAVGNGFGSWYIRGALMKNDIQSQVQGGSWELVDPIGYGTGAVHVLDQTLLKYVLGASGSRLLVATKVVYGSGHIPASVVVNPLSTINVAGVAIRGIHRHRREE